VGGSPGRWMIFRSARGSMLPQLEISACVYGCSGRQTTSSAGPISTMRPRYMTAMLLEM